MSFGRLFHVFFNSTARVVDKQVQRCDISIFFALTSECENHSCSVCVKPNGLQSIDFCRCSKIILFYLFIQTENTF
jgi:hypothetical protein